MPVDFEFTPCGRGVIVQGRDTVCGHELISAIRKIFEDERFLSLKYWIGDYSDGNNFDGNANDLHQISMMNKLESRRNPGIMLALVGASDLSYGICRQFEPFNSESQFVTRIFRNREDADAWIEQQLDK